MHDSDGKRMARGLFGWVLFIALAVMLFVVLHGPKKQTGSPPPPEPPRSAWERGAIYGGWVLVVVGLVGTILPISIARRLAEKWHNESTKVKMTQKGIHFQQADRSDQVDWSFIENALESPQSIVLYSRLREGWVIPKRAFDSEIALERFRQMIRNMIQRARSQAFDSATNGTATPSSLPAGAIATHEASTQKHLREGNLAASRGLLWLLRVALTAGPLGATGTLLLTWALGGVCLVGTAIMVLVTIVLWSAFFGEAKDHRERMRIRHELYPQRRILLDSTGMTIEYPGRKLEVNWQHMIGLFVTPNTLTLRTKSGVTWVLAKQGMSADAPEQIRRWIGTNHARPPAAESNPS